MGLGLIRAILVYDLESFAWEDRNSDVVAFSNLTSPGPAVLLRTRRQISATFPQACGFDQSSRNLPTYCPTSPQPDCRMRDRDYSGIRSLEDRHKSRYSRFEGLKGFSGSPDMPAMHPDARSWPPYTYILKFLQGGAAFQGFLVPGSCYQGLDTKFACFLNLPCSQHAPSSLTSRSQASKASNPTTPNQQILNPSV